VAAQEDAEEASGFAVGDAVFAVTDEAAEDDVDVEGNVGGGEAIDGAAKVAPAGQAGDALAGRRRRGQRFGAVMPTKFPAAQGEAVAILTAGQDVGAFGAHSFLQ
jgi:hypothetical protein